MPITTTSELRSASQWYPCPPNPDPADGLDLVDLQNVTWVFIGLTLQEVIELYRALSWHAATRVIQRGEIGLIAGVLTGSTASRALTTQETSSVAVLTKDSRSVALQE